jgi:tRNA threonylcarbamoyladenosine biosynthesis protein TsaB
MRSLLIETSTEKGLLAFVEDDRVLYQALFPSGNSPSKTLMLQLEKGLKSTGMTLKDFTFVATGIGPGSYTGIRLGAITAKTLSFSLSVPLIGISTLKAFIPPHFSRFAVVIDAKIGGVYIVIGTYSAQGVNYQSKPALVSIEEAPKRLENVEIVVTPNAISLHAKCDPFLKNEVPWLELEPNPIHFNQLAHAEWKKGNYTLDGKLELVYLRKTQAELDRQKIT